MALSKVTIRWGPVHQVGFFNDEHKMLLGPGKRQPSKGTGTGYGAMALELSRNRQSVSQARLS